MLPCVRREKSLFLRHVSADHKATAKLDSYYYMLGRLELRIAAGSEAL